MARSRFTFGSEAVRRLIGSRFACGRFPPGSFRFKARDLAPAYMTCMERTEHSPETLVPIQGLLERYACLETLVLGVSQIPSGVVFRIPSGNESAKNPPEGFFTCYEAFLVYCRMWFPIPGTIVRALRHFGLSISQLSVPALQHWLGVLILSYELGMDLNPGDFEGFWFTRGTGIDGSYRMAPKKGMAIIQGHTSHPKAWFERFFFVRIDGEPVKESYLHLFRQEWNFTRVNRILPPTPADLFAKRDLLRNRPFFWNSFTVKRIRSVMELHRSRAVSQPLDVPYGVEPVIDVLPAQRQRIRSRKGKGVASENVLGNLPLPEWNPGFSPRERSGTSEVPLPSDFFDSLPPGFTTHKSLDEESRRKVVAEGSSLINEGMRVFNAALDGSFRESRISHFKAEEAERELFQFRKEVEEQSRRQAELHSLALDAQKSVGDFRECRGSVATIYESQNEDFSFLAKVAEMLGLMNGCAHAESLFPPIEGRVRRTGSGPVGLGLGQDVVRDMAPAYMTCMERTEHSPETVWSADQNFRFLVKRAMVSSSDVREPLLLRKFPSKACFKGMRVWRPLSWVFLRAMDSGIASLSGAVAWAMNRILPPTPADLFAKRDLLRGRPFFWNSFTVEWNRSAVELHRSRAVSQPLDVPYDVEPVIDVLPAQRQRTRSRKGKGVASENVLGNPPLPEWNPSFSPGERSGTSEVSPPSEFFADLPPGFITHEYQNEESRRKVVAEGSSLINEGMRVFNAALDGSFRESRISHFKAEEAEREFFRFWKEVEEESWRKAELHSRALVLATLYKSQNEDFSFPTGVAEMSGLMNGCAHAKSLVPLIEGRVRQLRDSIEVSEDTVEEGTGVGDEGAIVADGEVDQPASSFGVSMSGFFDFEL
ncbi:hypothetical protein F2Q69_00042478 [Brassica cretica]|uniref:Uncharacterized protein n=1 Tax=Brassica cretica TaxID=69181 RepID=A0A8S9NCC0_BRACR|nr:hypothetical protein F2Q69_00042478 [Brassica cretica]